MTYGTFDACACAHEFGMLATRFARQGASLPVDAPVYAPTHDRAAFAHRPRLSERRARPSCGAWASCRHVRERVWGLLPSPPGASQPQGEQKRLLHPAADMVSFSSKATFLMREKESKIAPQF